MAFRIEPQRGLAKQVRRITCKRLCKALGALRTKSLDPRALDGAVHKARRHIREARALLRLVRDGLGDRTFRRENDGLRAASGPLSQVRDAKALVDALRTLEKHFARKIRARALGPVMTALRERRDRTRQRVLVQGRALSKSARRVDKVTGRIKGWKLKDGGWKTIGPGLRVTYREALDAMKRSGHRPSDEHLHEWRKRSKDLRHQLELLGPAWPRVLNAEVGQLKDLTSVLGDDHDLSVMSGVLGGLSGRVPDHTAVLLRGLIERRRAQLQSRARALGAKLLAEKPAVFERRMASYWDAARSGS